jgi:hypothetical protein
MARKIRRSDVVKLTVDVVALDQAFTAVFEATCHGQRAARHFNDGSAGFESPLDDIRTIVLLLFGSERVIKLPIGMYVKVLVGERIKEDSFEPGKSAVQRLLQPGFIDRIVDVFRQVALSVEEVAIDEPIVR